MYSNKCSEGLGFDHYYVQSPCNFLIEDYTEMLYTIYKWNVSSIQCKMGLRWSTTARKVDPLSLIFKLSTRVSIPRILHLHGPTENTAFHNSSIIAYTTVATLTWRLLCSQLVTNVSSE
jgi:hypothetical protein